MQLVQPGVQVRRLLLVLLLIALLPPAQHRCERLLHKLHAVGYQRLCTLQELCGWARSRRNCGTSGHVLATVHVQHGRSLCGQRVCKLLAQLRRVGRRQEAAVEQALHPCDQVGPERLGGACACNARQAMEQRVALVMTR